MDVDDHPSLEEALNQIKKENQNYNDGRNNRKSELIPIISNECFEVWYILHFEYTTGALYRPKRHANISDNRRIDKVLAKYLDIDYRKANPDIYKKLKQKESDALHNAERLSKEQDEMRNEKQFLYQCNPYTDVYKLINRLNMMGRTLRPVNPNEIEEITLEYLETFGISFSSEDEFVKTLLQLINRHYPNETQKGKLELLTDMLQNDHNTACNQHQDTIAPYFYQHYYLWKNSSCYRDLAQ